MSRMMGQMVETKKRYVAHVVEVRNRSRKEKVVKLFGCWAQEQVSNGLPSSESKRTRYLEGSKDVLQR